MGEKQYLMLRLTQDQLPDAGMLNTVSFNLIIADSVSEEDIGSVPINASILLNTK